MVILPSTLLYVHVPHRHPAVWDILLSSLILNELCCNFEMKTELVYSLQKLQACVTRLKKLGRIRLSRAFPSTVEHKSTIELTLWHRIPALNGQESSLIDMWKLAESSLSISDWAFQLEAYAWSVRLVVWYVAELRELLDHFTAYVRTAPSQKRLGSIDRAHSPMCCICGEKRMTFDLYILVPPILWRGDAFIAIFAIQAGTTIR